MAPVSFASFVCESSSKVLLTFGMKSAKVLADGIGFDFWLGFLWRTVVHTSG